MLAQILFVSDPKTDIGRNSGPTPIGGEHVVAIRHPLFKQFRLNLDSLAALLQCGKLTRGGQRNVRRREFMTLLGGDKSRWFKNRLLAARASLVMAAENKPRRLWRREFARRTKSCKK